MKSKEAIKGMIKKCEKDMPELVKRKLFTHEERLRRWIDALNWVLKD